MKREATEPVTWGLSVLATYRLVRLAIEDTIFDETRDKLYPWLARGGPVKQWFLALITCPWCLGVWVAALVTLASRRDRSVVARVVWWLSIAAIQPWVHMIEGVLHSVNSIADERDTGGPIVYETVTRDGITVTTARRFNDRDEDDKDG